MKKTCTINLGGRVYNIDEDAYKLLEEYLQNLRICMQKEEGAEEIVDDIETRIAELFLERLSTAQQVISIKLVDEVIAILGKPEEFSQDEDSEEVSDKNDSEKNKTSTASTHSKRLFRDGENKMLGGVASGLGAYLGWDTTLIRLVLILLLFLLHGTPVVVYIIGWILIPEAKSAADKLRMQGKEVTMENIGKTVSHSYEKVSKNVKENVSSDQTRSFFRKVIDVIVEVFGIILKVLLILVALIASPFLLAFCVILLALLVAGVIALIAGVGSLITIFPVLAPLSTYHYQIPVFLSVLSWVVMVGVPLMTLVYMLLRSFFHWSPMSTRAKWVVVIIWLIATIYVIFSTSFLIDFINHAHFFPYF